MKMQRLWVLVVLLIAGAGLPVAFAQPPASVEPTPAQLILRQKLSELQATPSVGSAAANVVIPSKSQVQSDLERMVKQGKISREQFAKFQQNLASWEGPAGPDPAAQEKALMILHQYNAEPMQAKPVPKSPAPRKP